MIILEKPKNINSKIKLVEKRYLNKRTLRLANELQMKCATKANELLLFSDISISSEQWGSIFKYLVHTMYAINLVDTALFNPRLPHSYASLDMETLSNKDLCAIHQNVIDWYKSLPLSKLAKHHLNNVGDNAGEIINMILGDESSSMEVVNKPSLPLNIIEQAQAFAKEWFFSLPDNMLKENNISKTEQDFYKLLQLPSWELEGVETSTVESFVW